MVIVLEGEPTLEPTDANLARRRISIIVPVYNESENIERAHDAVVDAIDPLSGRFDFEILFLDNHSTDDSFERLRAIAQQDPRVRVLRYSRDFGFQRSILTGYRLAIGDAAIQIDCDLQDPPALIPDLIAKWDEGHDVVVGIREGRKEGPVITSARRLYYRLVRTLSEEPLPLDAGDFRLIDRRVLDQLDRIDDVIPYVRGLISSLAARETGIPYHRDARQHGKSKFPVRRLISLAMDGLFAHSVIPLRLASYAGLAASLVAIMLSGWYISRKILLGSDWPTGFATLTVLLLFGIGLNGLFLGIIGEYVGRIYRQIRLRPTTVVEEAINMDPERIEKAVRLR